VSGIFISYRREDSAGHAGHLYDRLVREFGPHVFMDVDSLDPGVDFVERLEEALASCDVVLAVIGRAWSSIRDANGLQRLANDGDFVRLEIATALARDVRVIPVLVSGATMPPRDELPDDIAKLSNRHALELSDSRWDFDFGRLARALSSIVGEAPAPELAGRADQTESNHTAANGPLVAELTKGSTFAGYRIGRTLGTGGLGIVYDATHMGLGQQRALKVLSRAFAANSEFRHWFTNEWRAAAAVQHPHLVTIYDAGEYEGALFMAMELVEARDLGSILADHGPLDLRRAAAIVDDVASALDAAHARGIVHRDVKPGNVLIRADGFAYLSDLGLTRVAGIEPGYSGTTTPGAFIGTVDFMAPEQISDEETDARTDIYALGAVFFAAVTGGTPFTGSTSIAQLYAAMTQPRPKVSAHTAGLPRELDEVVERAMAIKRDERYASAGEFAQAVFATVAALAPSTEADPR
jgi:serine/threonine-protein kinase